MQKSIAEDFIGRFAERAKRIRVGDPLDPRTEVGPLAFREHYERVLSFVQTAEAEGADILAGGRRAPGFDKGYYFSPTAVRVSSNQAQVCQQEIFGPFASFLTFDTVDEAINIANESRFGLVGYLWSNDVRKVMSVSQGVRAGTIWVNTPLMRDLHAPFGGFGESGIGRDGAQASLDFYTEQKTTSIPLQPLALRALGTGD